MIDEALIILFFDGTVGNIKEKSYVKKTEEERMEWIADRDVIRIGVVVIVALACGWRFFTWSRHHNDPCPAISGTIGLFVGGVITTVLTSLFV
ncbi:MAG: hypothetical protein WC819_03785 [Parcubacteria group bacterium]|jgi:hypothetical protein